MKKIVRKFIKNTSLLLGLLSIFSSCKIGLGAAVDLTPPVLKVSSHSNDDTVAEKFTLAGTASDNEAVTEITIDFEDADIHYKIEPGNNWFKKTSSSDDWIEILEDTTNYCKFLNNIWCWSIDIDTADKIETKDGSNYSFTGLIRDKAGNSGKNTKVECTLVVDVESPDVSIQQPELLTGEYGNVKGETDPYILENGNCIAKLLNGKIQISGRVDQSISFKGLRIDFDNGEVKSGVRKSSKESSVPVNSIEDVIKLNDASLGDLNEPKIYFTKTLEDSNLRTWTITVDPEDLINSENGKADNLKTGKHLIRVVSTCLSASNAWERKILGYFVWWPEADTPWITVSSCDNNDVEDDAQKYSCFPGSFISGSCQDDDGIKSFVSTIYKKENGNYEAVENGRKEHINSDTEILKYLAFSVGVPTDTGSYKIDFKVIDVNGNERELTKYFKTSDVSAPKLEIITPEENTTAIQNKEGNITFSVKATDDGAVKTLALVWLNPAKANDVSNKINYLTGSADYWGKAKEAGYDDANGNKLYLLVENGSLKDATVSKDLNIYSDLGINGKEKKLSAQEFIFYASDGISNTIKTITLTGDTITPELSFDQIKIGDQEYSLETPPTFKKLSADDKEAIITGKWSDKFNSDDIDNTEKFAEYTVKWGNNTTEFKRKSDGTWFAEVVPPADGGTITAVLSDFAGNKKTIQSAASIESTDLSLARIGCNEDDGAYTTGKDLNLTLEFTKNTDVDTTAGTPTLTLNNGGTATYESGSETPVHVYKYTIGETDRDVEKLSVKELNTNGAKWYDSAVEKIDSNAVTFGINKNVANLDSTRTIAIDKTKPKIKSITSLAAAGSYKLGSPIPLMLEFSEDVTIENPSNLTLNFAHNNAKTSTTSVSGSKYVLFTYVVKEGDNANPLTFSSISHDSVTIKDNAGNILDDWNPSASSFTGIVIDTEKPSAPSFGDWSPASYIIDSDGTSFTLAGEAGATIEYSIDNGASWLPYTSTVTLKNNGDYNVTARQTDVAGNISKNAVTKSFTIDAGELLTKITANTPSGTYSTNTSTKKIVGRIEFRKAVTLPGDAKVTLNVKNDSGTAYECAIKETSGKEFTFEYTITEGDYIDDNAVLDVTSFNFSSVNVDGKTVDIESSQFGTKSFSTNRNITILTGKPVLQSAAIEGTTLNVKFDRPISKLSGNIVLEYDDKKGNEFRVPIVLSASEYNELKSNETIKDSYEAGTNGATVSGTTLVNDTTTKYILKTGLTGDDRNTVLVAAFKAANKHKVTIPIIANEVSVTGNTRAATGDTLTVDLSGTYKVPVKGAVYKLTIPANAVTDAVSNKNALSEGETVTAAGVEAPEIRIVKPKYKIYNKSSGTNKGELTDSNWVSTASAYVNMSEVQYATMYINCRTPGAYIYYTKVIHTSDAVTVNDSRTVKDDGTAAQYTNSRNTGEPTAPTSIEASQSNKYSNSVSLGTAITNYTSATGLKIAIASKSVKGSDVSGISYEYATRSVVKYTISKYRDVEGSANDRTYKDDGTNTTLKLHDLRPWLMGGDSSSGKNSIDTFPIAWSDTSKWQLMAGSYTNKSATANNDMYGEWYWVSWDITATAYIGFVVGDVPKDAVANGPKFWAPADFHWVPVKTRYPLYPGETLIMSCDNNSVHPMDAPLGYNFKNKSGHR